MITPFWLYVFFIALGILGSIGTLAWILVVFVKEKKAGEIW